MINGLLQLISDQVIGSDRFWSFSTTMGNIERCKIIEMKPNQSYIIVEEWYKTDNGFVKAEAFDLNCINVSHIIWAQLYKEEA